jgi:hypothetical protein
MPHTNKEPQDTNYIRKNPDTKIYQVTKRPTRQWKKRWTRTFQPIKDTRQTTWRNGWQGLKKKTRDRKTETTRWKKGSRTSREIQRKEQVFRLRTGYTRATYGPKVTGWKSSMPFLQHPSIRRPYTVGMQRNWGP